MPLISRHISRLASELSPLGVSVEQQGDHVVFRCNGRSLQYQVVYSNTHTNDGYMPLRFDLLAGSPVKIASQIQSRLHLNKVIYARQCQVIKLDKKVTADFLDRYHLMNSTSSAYQFGLVYQEELVAVATFSKGRKMQRLPQQQRSFELIRFCSRAGITVAGGLSKLLLHFARLRSAGDIMTYIDTSTSDGKAYLNAGFRHHGRTDARTFVVCKKNGRKKTWTGEAIDESSEYLYKNEGNLKLVFTPQA